MRFIPRVFLLLVTFSALVACGTHDRVIYSDEATVKPARRAASSSGTGTGTGTGTSAAPATSTEMTPGVPGASGADPGAASGAVLP